MYLKHLKDLREYIDALKAINEIQEIDKEVDWNLEIGGIIRRSYDLRAPAPLFNAIKGIKKGFRVFGAPAGASRQANLFLARVAVSLGLPPTANVNEILNVLISARTVKPVKPTTINTGPCKENILIGDDINLERFPVPYIHDGDGGRYFNTWGTIVVKSPDGSWVNWGISRFMLLNDKCLISGVVPGQHTDMIYSMWKKDKQPMPFALFQGGAPIIPFISGLAIPKGINEEDIIGGILGRPLELVKCETVDLYVPANAEIVVEGTMSLDELVHEGPMGEFSGSLCTASENIKPVMHVSAITYRNDPILPVVAAGYPIEENHTCWSLGMSAKILDDLRSANFPVTSCFIPFETAVHWLVVTVDRNYIWDKKNAGNYSVNELITRLKEVCFNIKPAIFITKIILVADDIDPSDINQVCWAFATRCRPKDHLISENESLPMPLVGFLTAQEKASLRSDKIIYNCLRPEEWTRQEIPIPATFEGVWPKEVKDKILSNWESYGYKV
ncbi:3-polyprenyl-4-hydroxybenzoate decarboxylase [Legionella santicrucis]|uniref:Pyrrole-2-carboxylic acid decarboxylase n=1 Tax=Legionella santicrucis TaxID=45074 RepID=A0A0W0YFU0_9GAMM|nr:UbiD family decarboxylase [Legionella santicrucis]KTD55825.1 3-polyprenyl-4-hydroxybenzoate decarboxylase [Legionella santicrucis]